MDRRAFLKTAVGGVAALLTGTVRDASGAEMPRKKPLNRAVAARELAEHRIRSMRVRRLRDRFPRTVGCNAKGPPAGRGGTFQSIVEGIPGAARGVHYSAYTFDKKGHLVMPKAPGFGLKLTT